jgi:hypothetical protein
MKTKHETNAPPSVVAIIAQLRAERSPLAARLDAIDLAIENLGRVYGLHGQPQAQVSERRQQPERREKAGIRLVAEDGNAVARREQLLTVIGKSPVGLTLSDLRKQTPKMDGKDRSIALQILKAKKQIKRAGNAWIAA